MKLYEMAIAPNPRRVRMFLAEKGLLDGVERVELDLGKGENLTPDFAAKNPLKKVPVLELDNGTCISETTAICRYFEVLHPESQNLFGESPEEVATIEQWSRWLDFYLFSPIGNAFQHTTDFFKHKMTLIREWGEVNVVAAREFLKFLDSHLAGKDFIVYDRLTHADIVAFCSIDFAKVVKIRVDDSLPNLQTWYKAMKSRPSANV